MERRHRRLTRAGENLLDQQVEVQQCKWDLEEATAAGHEVVADLRLGLKGLFGKKPSENFIGLRGETSREPLPLGRQLDRAAARLLDSGRPLPAARLAVKGFERADQARQLAARSSALDDAYKGWVTAVKVDAGLLDEKRKALEDFNETFVRVGGWFAAFYQLAGREDWARGVRPSRHRKGRTIAGMKIGRPRKKRRRRKAQAADEQATASPPATPAAAEPRPGPSVVLRPVPMEVVPGNGHEKTRLPAVLEIDAVRSRDDRSRPPLPVVRRFLSFLGRRE